MKKAAIYLCQRAREVYCAEGLTGCGRRTLARLLRKPESRWYVVGVTDLSSNLPMPKTKLPVSCEELTCGELSAFAEANFYRHPLVALEKRLDEGQHCFVARHEGRIVAGVWIQSGATHVEPLDRIFPLASYEVYAHNGFTVPGYRGKGIAPALYIFVAHGLAQRGYRKLIGLISPHNRAGLRACKKGGYHFAGFIGYLETFGLRWYISLANNVFDSMDNSSYIEIR